MKKNMKHLKIYPVTLMVGGMLYNNKRSNDLPGRLAKYKNNDNIQYPYRRGETYFSSDAGVV